MKCFEIVRAYIRVLQLFIRDFRNRGFDEIMIFHTKICGCGLKFAGCDKGMAISMEIKRIGVIYEKKEFGNL